MRFVLAALGVLLLGAPAHANAACSTGFVAFLGKFERGQLDQTAHTKFPLRYSHPDHDDPTLKQKLLWLDRQAAKQFESFPTPETQARLQLERTVTTDKAGRCAVRLNAPESDSYAMTFTFARWKTGWRLVEIEDLSL